mmetsp:Transcript_23550/g.58329  ORF Transcript_23550/g.58329 Transcript_23550/m.58329 type:complete len:206 (-) Transcript_23550:1320-1937(-)
MGPCAVAAPCTMTWRTGTGARPGAPLPPPPSVASALRKAAHDWIHATYSGDVAISAGVRCMTTTKAPTSPSTSLPFMVGSDSRAAPAPALGEASVVLPAPAGAPAWAAPPPETPLLPLASAASATPVGESARVSSAKCAEVGQSMTMKRTPAVAAATHSLDLTTRPSSRVTSSPLLSAPRNGPLGTPSRIAASPSNLPSIPHSCT